MSTREIQDERAIARETFVQPAAHVNADVSTSLLRERTISSTKSTRDTFESTVDEFCDSRFVVCLCHDLCHEAPTLRDPRESAS